MSALLRWLRRFENWLCDVIDARDYRDEKIVKSYRRKP